MEFQEQASTRVVERRDLLLIQERRVLTPYGVRVELRWLNAGLQQETLVSFQQLKPVGRFCSAVIRATQMIAGLDLLSRLILAMVVNVKDKPYAYLVVDSYCLGVRALEDSDPSSAL